jgi:hypothetical protein
MALPAGAERVKSIWHSICKQLATSSLEDLGMEHSECMSWKTASGFAQQMLCYTMLALLDLCLSTEVPKLLVAETAKEAVQAITCIIDSRGRLQNWLHGAVRPKTLTGAQQRRRSHTCRQCVGVHDKQ